MKKITLLMLIVFNITTHGQTMLLSNIREFYDGSSWQKSSATNYNYSDGTTLTSETDLTWHDGVWKNSYLTQYTTNFFSKKITRAVYSEWNTTTNKFETQGFDSYTYSGNTNDTNVKLLEIVSYEFTVPDDFTTQTNDYKIIISYGNNNMLEAVVFYNWNGTQWVNDEKDSYTYNASNKVISDVSQKWIGGQWVNSRKALYTYNSNNKLITVRGADWDEFNNNWKADANNAFEYVLDAQGNRISSKESTYESTYTYDTTQLMSNFTHPFQDKTGLDYFAEDFPYINKLLSETNNSGTNRTTYNYNSSITLSTESPLIVEKTISVYPNPARDILTIQNKTNQNIDSVIVTDLTGKKVLEQNNSNQLNLHNLAKGMYLLQVFSNKNNYQTKFIKE